MIPSLVFEYLIAAGAEVVGTVKRMAQCWPFTFNQVLAKSDKRTLVDTQGAPALFLKWCKAGYKYVFASAFRNGSGSVATAISTMRTQHQWEGIASKQNEAREYKEGLPLTKYFFQRVPVSGNVTLQHSFPLSKNLLRRVLSFSLMDGVHTMQLGPCHRDMDMTR